MKKQYEFMEPGVTRNKMIEILVRGLGRALTEQEVRVIYWLGDCEYETRGVLTDLFEELMNKEER